MTTVTVLLGNWKNQSTTHHKD